MKAPRELSRKQFNEAMQRNGFKHHALFWFIDTTGQTPGCSYSGIFWRNGKLARRATLAHLIRRRDEEIARLAAPKPLSAAAA